MELQKKLLTLHNKNKLIDMYTKEQVLKIVDSCFHMFASEYRTDAKELSNQIMIGIDKKNIFPVRKVCFFTLKDGRYLTENNKEITTDMLVKYPHQITDVWSFIILD